MGSSVIDIAHSLEGQSTHDDAGHNYARREDHLTEIAESVGLTSASHPMAHPEWADLPPNVRRALELLDNFDTKADQIVRDIQEMVNASKAALTQTSPKARRLAK